MRVVAYSIKSFEKEPLAIANHKKHEITLISNALTEATSSYAEGKEAVIVYPDDIVSAGVIDQLADLGIKYIATRSSSTDHIDQLAAERRQIKIANVPSALTDQSDVAALAMVLATETINNLDKWQGNRCLGAACICAKACRSSQIK